MGRVGSAAFALCLGLVVGFSGTRAAHAQYVLSQAYTNNHLAGPAVAQGAVIWNHGKPPSRGSGHDMLPFYVDALRDTGWDVFRLDRDWSYDTLSSSADALRDKVVQLQARGYQRIVLAGQSYG